MFCGLPQGHMELVGVAGRRCTAFEITLDTGVTLNPE
jgi:hypothetical protein